MVEAVVGVALRAIVASVVLGAVLALGVLAATRALALTASTRHALWTTALLATALMPLCGVGVSVWKAAAAPPVRPASVVGSTKTVGDATWSRPSRSADTVRRTHPSVPANLVPPLATVNAAAWTPRLSRALALGVVGVWVLGALIGLGGLVASLVRVRGLKKRSSPLDGALADELPWLTDVGPGREIWLRLSYETETPVAIGFRRPVILIPTELATADGLAAIESLVLHEHAHLRRYDDWTNLVQRTIERVFWFNPVVWLVGRRIALEREIASDDAVVEKTGAAHEYATSLWRLAREMRMPEHAVVAPGALLTRKQISVRIEQLLDKNRARLHRSPATALGVVLAGIVSVVFVATSAPALELPAPAAPPVVTTAQQTHARIVMHVAPPPAKHALSTTAPQPKPRQVIVYRYVDRNVPNAHAPVLPPMPHEALPPVPPPPHVAMPPVPPLPQTLPEAPPANVHRPHIVVQGAPSEVSHSIAKIVSEAMASVPAQIAQDMGTPRRSHHSLNGAKPTRELLAACTGCSLQGADLRGLDLHGLLLNGDDFRGADLSGANLAGVRMMGVSLKGANLSGADLRGAILNGVEIRGASFENAQLDNMKLVGVSLREVNLRGTSMRNVINNCIGCDLSHLDLHGQDLHGITLNGVDLSHTDLQNANLSNVRFVGVDMSHANLSGADLSGASLNGCDLSGVDLRSAKTTGMTLRGSGLDG